MEVLVDQADRAHALATLQTQRPATPEAGAQCFAVQSLDAGPCPKILRVVSCVGHVVPLLMVSRPLPRVLLLHTGGTLGMSYR